MCMIVWDWDPSAGELLLLSNRDEFYRRPAWPMHAWPNSNIYAGKDLEAEGSWLGYASNGRIAAITNFKNGAPARTDARSRGGLVTDFLISNASSENYSELVAQQAHHYNGFNLLMFDGQSLYGFESHTGRIIPLPPGISGVSNAGFDTPWPKLIKSKNRLKQLRADSGSCTEDYFSLLADPSLAPEAELPSTGIAAALEHPLSAVFVRMDGYGTRASSLFHVTPQDTTLMEKTFDANGLQGMVRLQLPRQT